MCRCIECIKERNVMIKMSLLGCVAIIMLTVSCVRSIEHSDMPEFRIRSVNNSLITIDKCPTFVENSEYTVQSLVTACNAAGFEKSEFVHESISDDIYVIYVYAQHGYAALWVNHKEGSCVIEFFCAEERYSYVDFISGFMREFDMVEKRKEWYQTFTDLLE